MTKRALLGAPVLVTIAALCACGGGTGGTPSEASPPSTLGPAGGSAVVTYRQTASGSGLLPGFLCLSPQYPSGVTVTDTATITQAVSFGASFAGTGGLTSVVSTIAMDGCSDGPETDTETDYYAKAQIGGHAVASLKAAQIAQYTSRFTPANTMSVRYAMPGGLARTIAQGAPANPAGTISVAADGSYDDSSVTVNGVWPYDAVTTIQHADGSGSQTTVAGANASAPPYVVSYSAPVNGSVVVSTTGSPPIDPLWPTPTPCPSQGCPTPSPAPSTFPAWYPFTPSPSHPLETEVTVDKGPSALPQTCDVAPPVPASADLLETTDRALDIWRGIAVTTTDSYMDPQRGLLCSIVTMARTYYYLGASAPTGHDTLIVTDALQNESGIPVPFTVPAPGRFVGLWR